MLNRPASIELQGKYTKHEGMERHMGNRHTMGKTHSGGRTDRVHIHVWITIPMYPEALEAEGGAFGHAY